MMNRWWVCLFAGLAVAGLLLLREKQVTLVTARAAETFPLPPSKEPEARNREAQRVEGILDELSARNFRGETGPKYRISESELNSYLSYLIEKEEKQAIDTLFVKLHRGFFSTYAIIDAERIPQKNQDPATRMLMKTLLAGKWRVSADGSLTARDGLGQYTLTAARIEQADIPPGIANAVINAVTGTGDSGFDLRKPFPLPYNIREAEVKAGYLEIS